MEAASARGNGCTDVAPGDEVPRSTSLSDRFLSSSVPTTGVEESMCILYTPQL